MAKKGTTSFSIDGQQYVFDSLAFKQACQRFCGTTKPQGRKMTLAHMYDELGDAENLSPDTIRNWYKGSNGPSDLRMIKIAAKYLKVDDYTELMMVKEKAATSVMNHSEHKMTDNYSERELVSSIYRGILQYRTETIDPELQRERLHQLGMTGRERYEKQQLRDMHREIDNAFLHVASDVCKKLHRLLVEVEEECKSAVGYSEAAPARWLRINPAFEIAKIFYSIQCGIGNINEDYFYNGEEGDPVDSLWSRATEGIEPHTRYAIEITVGTIHIFLEENAAREFAAQKERWSVSAYEMDQIPELPEADQRAYAVHTKDRDIPRNWDTRSEIVDYLKTCGTSQICYCVEVNSKYSRIYESKEDAEHNNPDKGCPKVIYEPSIESVEIDEIDYFSREYAITLQEICKEDFPYLFE